MIKFMRNIDPYRYPLIIRTILNFIRYHMLIRQIYYKDNKRELLAELMLDTTDGFNIGVEHFWVKYHARHKGQRYKTRTKLKQLANEISSELEDIQNAKIKEEKMKERQKKIKEENEKRRRPEYVEGYKPTVNELLNRDTCLQEMQLGKVSYKFYDVREKGAYVALILVEDRKPCIFCGPEYKKVKQVSFAKWLDLTKDEIIKPHQMGSNVLRQEVQRSSASTTTNEDFDIDIGHVERAMGINPENRTNNPDDDIDDLLRGLF